MTPKGLYLHIPYCQSKCAYCDFPSYVGRLDTADAYITRMCEEMHAYKGTEIATLYIGGGTPSLLPPPLMEKLLHAVRHTFVLLPEAECSCECNPGTLTPEFLDVLHKGGINRLSMGVQAMQPQLLQLLSRIHNWEQVQSSVSLARQFGFNNLNLDVMLGLPTQTLEQVQETLAAVLALQPTHISCYGLIVEADTPLEAQVSAGRWTLPDEDAERRMYDTALEILRDNGYQQYEISNFAKPGFACRHNVDCWSRREYIGIGCAAAGFVGNTRWSNPKGYDAYMRAEAPEKVILSAEDAQFESMMLGLRMTRGVSNAGFRTQHGRSIRDVYGDKLQRPLDQGLLEWDDDYLRLTRTGMDVQNRILVELM